MRRVLEGDIIVLPRDHYTCDVFIGETGWEGHRVFKYVMGVLRLVKGAPLSTDQYQRLCTLVTR